MSLTLHLARREARSVRWHVVGASLAATALAFGAAFAGSKGDYEGGRGMGEPFVLLGTVMAVVLAGGAVAADLFASDSSSRRIEGAALLPVGLGRVFASKALVVLLTCGVVSIWTSLSIVGAVATFLPASYQDAVEALGDVPGAVVGVLPIVAAIVLFAVVLEHGLGSILAGLVAVLGSVVACFLAYPLDEWNLIPERGTPSPLLAVPFVAVLTGAAWLAFVHGPIHLGLRVRRAVLGLGSLLVVVLGGGSVATAWLDARVDVAPGDPAARMGAVLVSPDGRHAALMVGNERSPVTCHAWLVDLGSGDTFVLPGRYREFHGWAPDGNLRLTARARRTPIGGTVDDHIDTIDVETGRILRTVSPDQLRAEPWDDQWARFAEVPEGCKITWRGRTETRTVASPWHVKASPAPGRAIAFFAGRAVVVDLNGSPDIEIPGLCGWGQECWIDGGAKLRYRTSNGRLHVLDCATGKSAEIAAPIGAWYQIGDGDYATAWKQGTGTAVVNLRTGKPVGELREWGWSWFVPGSGEYVVVGDKQGAASLVHVVTGAGASLRMTAEEAMNCVAALPGGEFLVARPDGSLEAIDASGRLLRTVTLRTAVTAER